jgi:hypothetical protein
MFVFRLNKVKIFDNRANFLFFDLAADVKIFSFVKTSDSDFFDLTELLHEPNQAKKLQLLKEATLNVVSSRVISEIQYVMDNHLFYFGDTGYVLHRSDTIPESFDWNFLAVRSKRTAQEIGQKMEDIINDDEFDSFGTNLLTILVTAVNPAALAYTAISKFILKIVAKNLKQANDDQIGLLYTSFTRKEHYPHGMRDKQDVQDLTNNMRIDYTIFGYEQNTSPAIISAT